MQSNWQTKKLGEVCAIVTGNTPKTSHKEYFGNDVLWAGPADLDQGVFVLNTNKKLSKKGVTEGGARLVPKDSVLLSCIGNIGKIGIAIEDMATNQQINTFVPNKDILDSKYLYYCLITQVEDFKNVSSQTTLPIINKTKCSNIEIPFPPLETQKKIAEILDEKFAKIREAKSLREQSIADTEKILSQTLHEIFEDGKEKEWEEKNVGDVCIKVTDGSHNPPIKEGVCKFIMLSSRNIYDDGISFDNPRYLTEEGFQSENKRTDINIGDVLLTIVGTIGRCAVVNFIEPKFTVQRSVAVLKPKDFINSYFLSYWLRGPEIQDFLLKNARGAAQKGFYLKDIKKLNILIPPLTEQKEIVKKLDALSEKLRQVIELQKSQLEDFKKLEKSYLREAFNGELV